MIRIRDLHIFTTLISISLSIALGILLLLCNYRNNVYNYLISIGSFVLAGYHLIELLLLDKNWISLGIQLLISLFNIISGILYILLHSSDNYRKKELHIAGVVLFIVNIAFMTICFMLICVPKLLVSVNIEDGELEMGKETNGVFDLLAKKASDATLCNDQKKTSNEKIEYSIENNWINNQDHGHIIPPSLSINSNLNQLNQQQQQQQRQSHLLHSSSTNSDLDKSRNISIMNIDDELITHQQHNIKTNNSNNHINNNNRNNSNDINDHNNCSNKHQIRKQRWKSIHDEKAVLANINENLLPGVLKQQTSQKFQRPVSNIYQEKHHEEKEEEDYRNALVGLEDIPNSTHNINQFDINDFNKLRKISGYNILPGTSNMINDENLYREQHEVEQYQSKDDLELLPFKETPVENIDNLSDVIKRPSLLTRSLSAPSVYDIQSGDAPSLYTFRKISNNSPPPKEEEELPVTPVSSSQLQQPTTPPTRKKSFIKSQSAKTSPIKKFFQESPKRIFKSRSSYNNRSSSIIPGELTHKHSNSVISNNNYSISLKSSFSSSSRSSPKKSSLMTKSSTMSKLHKYSISVPNFNMNNATVLNHYYNHHHHHNPTSSINSDRFIFHSAGPLKVEPIDLWDIQTTNFDIDSTHRPDYDDYEFGRTAISDDTATNCSTNGDKVKPTTRGGEEQEEAGGGGGSRISSLPSQVFGEYDKEKWMTLKVLQQQEQQQDMIHLNENSQVEVI